MARARPPRDRETAPGDEPGAESFATSAGRCDPPGIVRLSDLFKASNFEQATRVPGAERRAGAARPLDGRRRSSMPVADNVAVESARPRSRHPEAGSAQRPLEPKRPQADELSQAGAPAATLEQSVDPGPGYESLFGSDGDTQRRPKRERKPATALQRAIGLLTRREHSRKELTRKLVSRGVDASEVEAAVEKLSGAGWQDDRRFAESLVRSRASTGYGPLHIRAELATHDLPAELRETVLEEFEGNWIDIARDLVARRFGRIDDARQRERKACDYLVRRGFPGDVVRAAARFQQDD